MEHDHHDHSGLENAEEQAHFANVIAAFRYYARYSLSANNRRRKDFFRLPSADRELLAALGYKAKLDRVDEAIEANADFLGLIVEDPEIFGQAGEGEEYAEPRAEGHSHLHGHSYNHEHGAGSAEPYTPTDFDMDKLRSTLKQFVRDWSEEGIVERDACYQPIKDALLRHYASVSEMERRKLRVLVPGSGLGRLAHDVASLGFACQGNEFSQFMLLASHCILNRTNEINEHTIYPYVHSFSNIDTTESMLRAVTIPDVLPSSIPRGVDFSLVAGTLPTCLPPDEPQAGQWDAILTCFFIDTAKNVVNYLRIIHKILAPGGVWINLGPLLWHWENNSTNDPSIELTLEEVKELARAIGFDISFCGAENERTIDTTYTNNARGMLGYVYHAAFWTATKRPV
ncbi:unnamed protein product [Mycena citricolor]|uniref:carnosine N-methyltransferase n=1 Tax=Mycena citricolor TaxID=2018698 RepID=A0AAD2H8N3_9AGAR|nr:unnamed protein product [Mycena citricolor]